MSRYKMLVSVTMPHPDSSTTEPGHFPAGTVVEMSDGDAQLALSQGTAAPFDAEHGCPICVAQGRPCTIECFRGLGGKDEEYFPAMVAHEDRKRDEAFRARSQPSQEPYDPDPVDVVVVDDTPPPADPVLPSFPPDDTTTVTVVPDTPADTIPTVRSSRRPASQ